MTSFFRGDSLKRFFIERTYWVKYSQQKNTFNLYGMKKTKFVIYKNYNFRTCIWISHFMQGHSVAINFSIHSDVTKVLKENKPFSIIFSQIM